MSLAEQVPELIREGRDEAGLSQAAVAELVGVAQSTVSRWERGLEPPTLEQADLVLRSLGITVQLHRGRPRTADDGVDRSQIRAKLRLTPEERLDAIRDFSRFVAGVQRG